MQRGYVNLYYPDVEQFCLVFAVTILVQRKGCVCRSTERTSIAARMAAGKRGISLCACRTERQSTSLSIFGVIASTIIYGGIMNPASALMWSNTINWKIILSYYVTGLPVDLVRAIATFFLPVVDCRTHARKARPDQDQIRLGRVSSFVEMPFGLQRYTIAKAKPSNTFSVSVMLCLPSFLCPDAKDRNCQAAITVFGVLLYFGIPRPCARNRGHTSPREITSTLKLLRPDAALT